MGFFDKDKWQEIFGTMKKHKMRTALTALGVFWGIFMLVFVLGMGAGLENGVFKNFNDRVKNCLYVWTWRTSKPYKGFPPGRYVRMKLDDIIAIQDNIPEVDKIAPRMSINNTRFAYKDMNEEYELRGELKDMINIEALKVTKGRYINQRDIEEVRKVAVIGGNVKEVLFGDEEAIGKYIKIKGIDFIVVGVYGPIRLEPWTQSDMESVVIPLPTMSQTFGTGAYVDWFVCSAAPEIRVGVIEEKVKALLKERHNVAPDDPQGIGGNNVEKEFQEIRGLFFGIRFFLWFVGIGTLLAGIVGVSNIMLIIVKERTKEIGIRKALGATPGSIINMILTESIFITAISGYLGLLIGTFIVGGINFIMVSNNIEPENFYNPEINASVAISALITLIIAGTLAGLIPAIQASRINPVNALKDE